MAAGDGPFTRRTRSTHRTRWSAVSPGSHGATDGDTSGLGTGSEAYTSDDYTDLDQRSVSDTSVSVDGVADATAEQEPPDTDVDSETEEIYDNIARFKAEGPAKPNHTDYTVKLWRREGDFWNM